MVAREGASWKESAEVERGKGKKEGGKDDGVSLGRMAPRRDKPLNYACGAGAQSPRQADAVDVELVESADFRS
jgi:hypothetical protein